MAHELEKAQYEQDARWMAEPWTAWQVRATHITKEWASCTNPPMFGLDGLEYRRRHDAPEKCCRLCRHNITNSICAEAQKPLLVACVKHEAGYCPEWCPLDAESPVVINPADVLPNYRFHKLGEDEVKQETRESLKTRCYGYMVHEPDKCSTCRHEYEPKPRTIRIDAELPEPESTFWARYEKKIVLTLDAENDADAETWLSWWKEQVTR